MEQEGAMSYYTELAEFLRQTESRSERKLLDEAADAIEELAKTSIVKRIPCEVDHRKEYVELDGIRLVCEECQIVGWYRPGDGLVIDANDPTVDAVPVVRCRDCKHCDPEKHHCDHYMGTAAPIRRKPDDFCSYGEPKGE